MLQKFLKRSWVRGRGGLISFSIAIAMDCASLVPITIGSFLSPSDSLKINAYAPFSVWLESVYRSVTLRPLSAERQICWIRRR